MSYIPKREQGFKGTSPCTPWERMASCTWPCLWNLPRAHWSKTSHSFLCSEGRSTAILIIRVNPGLRGPNQYNRVEFKQTTQSNIQKWVFIWNGKRNHNLLEPWRFRCLSPETSLAFYWLCLRKSDSWLQPGFHSPPRKSFSTSNFQDSWSWCRGAVLETYTSVFYIVLNNVHLFFQIVGRSPCVLSSTSRRSGWSALNSVDTQ